MSELSGFAEILAAAILLSTIANRLVEGLVTPLFKKLKLDGFYLLYVAWVVSAVVVFLGRVNLLGEYIADPLTGQILTALVCGGGANLIHDLFDRPQFKIIEGPVEELPFSDPL